MSDLLVSAKAQYALLHTGEHDHQVSHKCCGFGRHSKIKMTNCYADDIISNFKNLLNKQNDK